jgi:hypothetical protein
MEFRGRSGDVRRFIEGSCSAPLGLPFNEVFEISLSWLVGEGEELSNPTAFITSSSVASSGRWTLFLTRGEIRVLDAGSTCFNELFSLFACVDGTGIFRRFAVGSCRDSVCPLCLCLRVDEL